MFDLPVWHQWVHYVYKLGYAMKVSTDCRNFLEALSIRSSALTLSLCKCYHSRMAKPESSAVERNGDVSPFFVIIIPSHSLLSLSHLPEGLNMPILN